MSTAVQRRRGTTAQHASFAGLNGELTVDTDKEVVVVHDGATAGGYPMMRENGSNSALALGSAGTPSLKFTGDPNTGIYSPGADQVAISTNGQGRLFIDASGNVGLGTLAPDANSILDARGLIYVGNGTIVNQIGFSVGNSTATLGARSNHGVEFRTNNTERLRITSTGTLNFVGAGTAGSTQAVSFNGSAPVNSLVIDSSGRLGVGTSSPGFPFQVKATTDAHVAIRHNGGIPQVVGITDANSSTQLQLAGQILSFTGNGGGGSEHMRLDASGRLGIGTQSPSSPLVISNGGANGIEFGPINGDIFTYNRSTSAYTNTQITCNEFVVRTNGSNERARIDTSGTFRVKGAGTAGVNDAVQLNGSAPANSLLLDASGRLLVGTSSSLSVGEFSQYARLQVLGNSVGTSDLAGVISIGRTEAPSTITAGEDIGVVVFTANNGGEFAQILCEADATAAVGDYPGRLVFSTTADGASSPTQRMVIKQSGLTAFYNGTPTFAYGDAAGFQIAQAGYVMSNVDGDRSIFINRKTDDGGLIEFAQDGVVEGSISVSGNTISYNGAHLSRWSQLPSGAERTEILRGSVLSNIDEMCEWGDEDNEQLNRMKVSDVEGDKNVSGVFQAWDDDDDTYTNDFYCAMTGDFIIRIAAGVTVERGDLLMSAGDGTAKPQDDDIIRSKTIAKVTSTNVSCTYDDGSYCVPCVLMAC